MGTDNTNTPAGGVTGVGSTAPVAGGAVTEPTMETGMVGGGADTTSTVPEPTVTTTPDMSGGVGAGASTVPEPTAVTTPNMSGGATTTSSAPTAPMAGEKPMMGGEVDTTVDDDTTA